MLKSRADRYCTIAISIHWLNVILILALPGSGFQAARAMDAATKAAPCAVTLGIAANGIGIAKTAGFTTPCVPSAGLLFVASR